MRNVKFRQSYQFEMPSNYVNSLCFFFYYINGISVTRLKNKKNCYKTLQKITDRLLYQKPQIYAKSNDRS